MVSTVQMILIVLIKVYGNRHMYIHVQYILVFGSNAHVSVKLQLTSYKRGYNFPQKYFQRS